MFDRERICVAYASDNNYAPLMGISILSLFRSNTQAKGITVFILDNGISDDNKEKLNDVAGQYGRELVFIPVTEYLGKLKLNMGARKISVVSYARLFLSSIVPDTCDRLIYLDCDVIVNDSLLPMWQTELDNALIAGVQDTVDKFFLDKIRLPHKSRYINAGVLLLNLELWRKEKLEQTFMTYIDEMDGNVPHHDQGVINHTSGERRGVLPLRYNVTANLFSFTEKMVRRMYLMDGEYYTQGEIDEAVRNPAVLHFTMGLLGRPWEEGCRHPKQILYHENKELSPWRSLEQKPDSMSLMTKIAAFVCRHTPNLFAQIYRFSSWILHLRA